MISLLLMVVLNGAPIALPLPGPMPKPSQSGLADVNGIKLYFASFGEGPVVVLLHGGAGNGDHWAGQIAALSEKHRVLVVDARGHGRSTRDAKPMSYALMADDVIALLDFLKIENAAVIGWSDGGAIGLELAIRYPTRVTKLVAFATNFDVAGTKKNENPATFSAYMARCSSDFVKLSPTPKDWKGLMAALRPMWKSQPNFTRAQIASITVPTLVMDGAHDEIIREEQVRETAALIKGAKLVFLADSTHFALFQKPDAFNRAVLEFID